MWSSCESSGNVSLEAFSISLKTRFGFNKTTVRQNLRMPGDDVFFFCHFYTFSICLFHEGGLRPPFMNRNQTLTYQG